MFHRMGCCLWTVFQVLCALLLETRVRKPSQRTSCDSLWPMNSQHEYGAEAASLLLRNAQTPIPLLRHSQGRVDKWMFSNLLRLLSSLSVVLAGAGARRAHLQGPGRGGRTCRGRGEEGTSAGAAGADGGHAALRGLGCCCSWELSWLQLPHRTPLGSDGAIGFPRGSRGLPCCDVCVQQFSRCH